MNTYLQPRHGSTNPWDIAQNIADCINAPEHYDAARVRQQHGWLHIGFTHPMFYTNHTTPMPEPYPATEQELREWLDRCNKAMFQELCIPQILDNMFN